MSTSRTYTAGAVLTAAQQNDLAQGTLGYAQVVANQGSITAVVDLTGLTVTVTVVTGRRIRIVGHTQFISTVANDGVLLVILEGATQLNTAGAQIGGIGNSFTAHAEHILTPTVGAHTYKLAAQRNGGSGTLTMQAAATLPAFILVEDIGT